MQVETVRVQAGESTIFENVDRASAVDVLAELVWNALDAEATEVDITVELDGLDAPHEVFVRDNGHGIPRSEVYAQFQTHGDSWKKSKRFSSNINRPLHGQLGRGRFLVHSIADEAEWRSVVRHGSGFVETLISARRKSPKELGIDGPQSVEVDSSGTTVRLRLRQIPKVVKLVDGEVHLQLTALLAASLLALRDVTITYSGQSLDPYAHIARDVELDLDLPTEALHGRAQPKLRVVEWNEDMTSKKVFLCDEHGGVVTEYKPTKLPPAPVNWSAYLLWEGFGDSDLMSGADLAVPDIRHGELLAATQRALANYLTTRWNEVKGSILAEWKSQGVYPYRGEPGSPAEAIERDIFDIVAVVASPAIGRDSRQKKLSLRLLQEATRTTPGNARRVLESVLNLNDDEQEVLVELLERTTLSSIVRAARTVADRADFLAGLRRLLYSDETRKKFREVDQLHPMLVSEPWVFGDEWNLALVESGLRRVVETAVMSENGNAEFASTPVTLPSGKQGRVDMVFYRNLPESESSRHLVVELKRPMMIGMIEYSQLNNYATAITDHPEVARTPGLLHR